MPTDVKAVVDDFKSTWAQMKAALDQARDEYTTAGHNFAETEAKINKFSDRMDEIETKLKRMPLDSALERDDEQAAKARERKRLFFSALRANGISNLDEKDRELAREYKIG